MSKYENLIPKILGENDKLINFDPELIYISLVKETDLTKDQARFITNETVRTLIFIGNNAKYLSGPLIREIVCIKLLENGFEIARLLYTRIGFPKYDLQQLLDTKSSNEINGEITNHVLKENNNVDKLIIKLTNNGSTKKDNPR